MKIPYTIPQFTDEEKAAVNQLLNSPQEILYEKYSKLCRTYLSEHFQTETLVTHSCTAALEMSALLLNIKPLDEVIIPSFTFVSTATAFTLFGAKPVFADIKSDTLNIDPTQLESLITSKTKAIVIVHYAGVACDLPEIQKVADKYQLPIVEDAAQCLGAKYMDQPLGTFGILGALSFHHTKNITAGLGGALMVNDSKLQDRARIVWQKGTNREAFIGDKVDKYTWQDQGSSYMISELGAALLYAQLSRMQEINEKRLSAWNYYHEHLQHFAEQHGFQRPTIPQQCTHNAHIYYLIAPDEYKANSLRQFLAERGIAAPAHYVPLHLAPAGRRFSETTFNLPITESIYKRILRLPLWEGISKHIDEVISAIKMWPKRS